MSSESDSKPRVIVFGGCGFIGRHVVELLVREGLAGAVRVVDKTPPQTAWLSRRHADLFNNSLVEFRQANLINPAACAAALAPGAGGGWELAVNCAGASKLNQARAVCREGIVTLGLSVARACVAAGVRRLVQLSSGLVYPGDKSSHGEEGPLQPWSECGRCKLELEQQLAHIAEELDFVLLRPALVYGPADTTSLMPRVLVGGVYKELGEVMRLLWTEELRLHTVHVRDVARAAWHVASCGARGHAYNVVDEADSTQGSITHLIANIFNIKYEFIGNALSLIAKTDIAAVAEEANDKHLSAWARACAANEVTNTPLEPSTRPEMLLNHHVTLAGDKLARLGWRCSEPRPTLDNLREVLDEYVEMKVFPKSLLL